jgi:hypothetical protein
MSLNGGDIFDRGKKMSNGTMKFTMSRLGVDIGVIWGVNLLLLAYASMLFGIGGPVVAGLATLYMGYAATFVGGLIGFVLGFVHGYILGVVSNFVMKFMKK